MNKNKDASILVYSCLKNKDMWHFFSVLFSKYYSECQYPVVLVTDHYESSDEYVFDDVVECDAEWGTMIKTAILKCGSPYVFLFMDDYLIDNYVDASELTKVLSDIKTLHADNIRLFSSQISGTKEIVRVGDYKKITPRTAYCLSTHVGVWKSQFLLDLIDDNTSPWYFEHNYSMITFANPPLILESLEYHFPYVEAVRKGKWMRAGVDICKRNGIKIDFTIRKKLSMFDNTIIWAKGVLLRIAPNFVQNVQNKLGFR